MSNSKPRTLLPILSGLAFLGMWYAIHFAMDEERRFLVPAPHHVSAAFGAHAAALFNAASNTVVGAFIGLASAVARKEKSLSLTVRP